MNDSNPNKSNAAKLLGAIGGRSVSERKRDAVRKNGKLGGRPKLKRMVDDNRGAEVLPACEHKEEVS